MLFYKGQIRLHQVAVRHASNGGGESQHDNPVFFCKSDGLVVKMTTVVIQQKQYGFFFCAFNERMEMLKRFVEICSSHPARIVCQTNAACRSIFVQSGVYFFSRKNIRRRDRIAVSTDKRENGYIVPSLG